MFFNALTAQNLSLFCGPFNYVAMQHRLAVVTEETIFNIARFKKPYVEMPTRHDSPLVPTQYLDESA